MQEVKQKQTGANQIEDSVMKTMVRFFADEMLPYLGIKGKVKMIAPTEEIHMEIKRLYEDMNLIMEDFPGRLRIRNINLQKELIHIG